MRSDSAEGKTTSSPSLSSTPVAPAMDAPFSTTGLVLLMFFRTTCVFGESRRGRAVSVRAGGCPTRSRRRVFGRASRDAARGEGKDARGGTHRAALLHGEGGVLARDGGELEVHVASVLPAAGTGGKGDGRVSHRAVDGEESRSPPRAFRSPRLGSVVPSNDELFVGDVERARDVTVVGELHEPRDDAGHLCFRSPRRWVPSRRRGGEWRAVPAGSPEVVVRNKTGGEEAFVWHHEETKFDHAIRGNLRLLALS